MEDEDQFTVPLEDTVAMDSPILETQLGTLVINTEVLDSPDFIGKTRYQTVDDVVEDSVKDIVLDSDEEGHEVLSITSSGLSLMETKRENEEYASNREGGKHVASGCIRGKPRRVSGHSFPLLTSGRRIDTDEYCKAGQPGCAFHHAGAIYPGPLLVSDLGISKVNEKTSPEININYVDKDHQRWQCTEKVTRRSLSGDVLNEQNSAPANCEIMEKTRDVPFASSHHELPSIYGDSQEPGEASEVNALSFVDQFLSVNSLTLSEKVGTERAKGTKSPLTSKAKGVQTLVRRTYSAAKARKPGIFDWTEEQTTEGDFIKELDAHCDMGSLEQHLEKDENGTNMPELFDIGFATQIAAEAMEALMYAEPSNSNARQEVPENNISNSPEIGIRGKMKSKVCSHRDMAGSNSEITCRQSEKKDPSNKLLGSISSSSEKQYGSQRKSTSMSPLKNKIICRESTSANSFQEHPVNMKKNMNGRSTRVFCQQKEDETPQRHNLKEDSESVERKNHGEDPRTSSQAIKRLKYSSSMSSLARPKDPVSSVKSKRSCKLEFIAPETKQKKNSIKVQVHKKLGVSGKCSKLGSDASEVTNLKRTRQNSASDLNGTTSTLELDLWQYPKGKRTRRTSGLELNLWKYPKGKRTRRNLAQLSNEDSNPSVWFPVHGEGNKIHYPTQNRKTTKWMDSLVAFSQLENQSVRERRRSVSLSKHKGEMSSPGFDNCESAISNLHMATMELDIEKSSRESCRIDGENSFSAVDYSENIKLDAVLDDNKVSETSRSDEYCRKSSKNILSKPSLIKELTRLGYNQSFPDFLPREARRQSRATACILFSQHLEPNIINQQKKFIARLGFSVASCCSDATHFIADRFLRTRNMLEAIASGKSVVTPSWLESCARATYHVDEKNYILRDATKEKEIGFSMPVSLAYANQYPLLKGRRVFITPNIKPGKDLIQSLVKAVQGEAIQKFERVAQEDEIISNDVLILSSDEDYAACVPFLDKGAAVYDSELLLNGIVIQKLEYERHQLFTNYDENKGSKSKLGRKKTSDMSLINICK